MLTVFLAAFQRVRVPGTGPGMLSLARLSVMHSLLSLPQAAALITALTSAEPLFTPWRCASSLDYVNDSD